MFLYDLQKGCELRHDQAFNIRVLGAKLDQLTHQSVDLRKKARQSIREVLWESGLSAQIAELTSTSAPDAAKPADAHVLTAKRQNA